MAKKGAPMGNKNAAGNRGGLPTANRIVTYRTGLLGKVGLGREHVGFGLNVLDKKTGISMTHFMDKDRNPGLPKSASHIKEWTFTPAKKARKK